ncbi:MAG: glutamyl- and glutaminyl-tRNA synthetase [Gammaproteobacteria bacterium]|jgi:glutamyl-tRNA synthetase|nr:glutamyl- and glutaminyl-tRNA synthetase [Gammaproteobacteria bacterium]
MIKTRFAPSPTGHLHIGGARTALYAWLYARKHKGHFILRIEDTDHERSTKEYVDAILEGMQWLGLDYDEGPFYQSERYEHYRAIAEQLISKGHAYRCYCSKERLEKLREAQMANKDKPRYDGHCRELNLADLTKPHVIRFRTPDRDEITFRDQVYGVINVENTELDDLVLIRTDGIPTYNFAVVIDDLDMKITHVIRGDDHINNTPRQINLYHALNHKPPIYTHVPMILGPDGKRLSKRHGATSVMQYRDEGYLPEALLNYLVRLGWSHGDQEIFSLQEMIDYFDVAHINKAPAAINPDKLLWLNQHYLKTSDPIHTAKQLAWHMQGIDTSQGAKLADIVVAQAERCKTLVEMAEKSQYFYQDFAEFDPKAAEKNLTTDIVPGLQAVLNQFKQLATWEQEHLHQIIIDTAERLALKLGKLAQPIRVAVTGNTMSPPLDITLKLLGRERVLTRLQKAIDYIK